MFCKLAFILTEKLMDPCSHSQAVGECCQYIHYNEEKASLNSSKIKYREFKTFLQNRCERKSLIIA